MFSTRVNIHLRRFFSVLCVAVLINLSACDRSEHAIHKFEYFAFGTLISLTIAGVDELKARAASEKLEAEFNRMHHDWHAWEPSPLVDINDKLAAGETVELNAEFGDLISRSMQMAEISQNTFHPGMGDLLNLWGFQGEGVPSEPPSQETLQAFMSKAPVLSDMRIQKLNDDQISVQSNSEAFQFDLGGFAKGYGIDRAIELLQSEGINNAIVNAGGDLRAIGQRPDRPWRIGIRHPRDPAGKGVMAYLDLEDGESVFTSGDYERYFFHEDKRYHHILDPRSGYPADQAMSVTILHHEAALADAAATALFVAGPSEWQAVAESMGIQAAMIVNAKGEIQMTPAMKERLHLTVERIESPAED